MPLPLTSDPSPAGGEEREETLLRDEVEAVEVHRLSQRCGKVTHERLLWVVACKFRSSDRTTTTLAAPIGSINMTGNRLPLLWMETSHHAQRTLAPSIFAGHRSDRRRTLGRS